MVQQLLSDLHSPEDVRSWLTTARHTRAWLHRVVLGGERATNTEDRIPSIAAAITLTMASKLLRIAVVALFVALGIYLGSVYQSGLGTLEGQNADTSVLIVFIVVLSFVLCDSFLPMAVAIGNGAETNSTGEELGESGNGAPTLRPGPGGIIRDALEASIRAQEESVRAQKDLLALLNTHPRGISHALATTTSN